MHPATNRADGWSRSRKRAETARVSDLVDSLLRWRADEGRFDIYRYRSSSATRTRCETAVIQANTRAQAALPTLERVVMGDRTRPGGCCSTW
jgi:hypothetical protein